MTVVENSRGYDVHMPPICQTSPFTLNVTPGYQNGWRDDAETDSIPGYLCYGRQWFSVLTEANKETNRHFQWLVNINITSPLTIEDLKKKKAQLLKNLGRTANAGLSVFWRLQINAEDRDLVHFHFVVLDGFTDDHSKLDKVFRDAAKPLGSGKFRLFIEPVRRRHSYLAYVLKIRPKDRRKIVLWSKGLPRFSKAGVIRYPWPPQWIQLPPISAKYKGGVARRFRSHRSWKARDDTYWMSLRITDKRFLSYLGTRTGKSDYEVRQLVLQNLDFWEDQCDTWLSQQGPDHRLRERLDRADREWRRVSQHSEPSVPPHGPSQRRPSVAVTATFKAVKGGSKRRKATRSTWLVKGVFSGQSKLRKSPRRPRPVHSVPKLRQEPSEISVFRAPLVFFDPRIPLGSSP